MSVQVFNITGMTCNSCRTQVQQSLQAIPAIDHVEVSLENAEAVIKSNKTVSIKEIENALLNKYAVSKKSIEKNVFQSVVNDESEKSKLEQLKPLFLIFIFLIGGTALAHYNNFNWREAMLDFMGLFFVVFSFFKLLDLKGFASSFSMYDPLAGKVKIYSFIYPFIELALAIMFLLQWQVNAALIITLLILSITTIGVCRSLMSNNEIQCACLGTALKLPMTEATFIENAVMIIMALVMLVFNF